MRACSAAVMARRHWHRKPDAGEVSLQRLEPRRQIVGAVSVHLDAQQRAGLGLKHAPAQRIESGAFFRVVEDEPVHHLDRRRTMTQDERRRRERVQQIVELDRQHGLGGRQRHEADLGRDDEAERPLRPDDQLREVERLGRIDELVEVVAADAPQDFREAAVDLVPAGRGDLSHRAVALRLERVAGAGLFERHGVQRPEVGRGAVGQHDVLLEHVVDRLAVQDRPRAARVVRDHAAHRRAACGGDVGREAQAVRAQVRVELVEHDARLDPGPALGGVHLEDAIEILRRVELKPGPDRLARLRRAAAARGDRDVVPRRDLDRADDIVTRPGDDHGERFDPVDAGVRGVKRPRHAVEPHLSGNLVFEVSLKSGRVTAPRDSTSRAGGAGRAARAAAATA